MQNTLLLANILAKNRTITCPRANAALILSEVVTQHRSLNTALAKYLPNVEEKDRGFCQQLCYSSLRHYPSLSFLGKQLLKKPFKNKDSDIYQLLLLGLSQLRFLHTPDHAAISETVNASKKLNKPWAGGLINACLRGYLRQQATLEEQLKADIEANTAHPHWLIDQYQHDWPDQWLAIVNANNQQPPMMLRVNQQKSSTAGYLEKLEGAEIASTKIPMTDHGLLLDKPRDVYALPEFVTGSVSVQDGSAQLAAQILDVKPGQRILDACAAPGGKTCHILELAPENSVVAIDISAERLTQIEQNTQRLQLKAEMIAADAADVDQWWDGELFDRILIDAPCTGSGVIRRHPDIKLLRQPDDIASLAAKQQQLLDKLWPLLKPDGLLVYTTCSVFKQENELQIEAFLQRHPIAKELKLSSPPARERPFGYQRLPGDDIMDGFYYACLQHK
ncbi:MAG TPA: 16S rRNA (cytosine(967)-C(5))-methyltransferase RsmB [Methylophaga aminisulfidivorans]|uniref:16S rRNA (cytosine(967)-C(5))-methyltransferase n=1 Tax=Methylophaga aminisulfidivorans TaxID=230105 RepID=A0A7C2AFA0_9GAMM|nr:16S rRNA (cytosine(967)-C(5))-methyltransferase RsmB [Methylophaga aminisulfidivorans]